MKTIPRIIWILWLQGFDNAPDVVQRCLKSWQDYNPDWKVVALDAESLSEYLDLREIIDVDNRPDITVQKVSNIIRTNLLATYGGVWADATCLCCKPLNTWIDEYASSGFFAFYKPNRDRLLSNWFLASSLDCYLTTRFCQEHNQFWNQHRFVHPSKFYSRVVVWLLKKIFNRNVNSTRLWFSPPILKIARVYPYQIYHYHFAKVIDEDQRCKEIWQTTKQFSADIPHKLKHFGLTNPITEELKQEIDAKMSPCYKLTWKYKDGFSSESVVKYVLSQP